MDSRVFFFDELFDSAQDDDEVFQSVAEEQIDN